MKTAGSGPPVLTASHIYDFLICPHKVYLDKFGDRSLMDSESDFEKLLWEKGMAHEEDVIEKLGLDVSRIDLKDPHEWESETLRLMNDGKNFIYQGVLASGLLRGRPDLLEKTGGKSRLGSHHYIPVEMKSGSAYQDEEAGTLKEHYALQLSFYADVLERVQGVKPGTGKIIDGEFRAVPVELGPFEERYTHLLSEIRALLSGKTGSEPCIGSICGQCHWKSYCYKWAKENDDVSLIRRVSRSKKSVLKDRGISTVQKLAHLGAARELPSLAGISHGALKQMVRRAVVMERGKPVVNSPVELPVVELELYFDIETEPWADVCYLYGIVEKRGNRQRFVSFFADSPAEEESTWKNFWEYISQLDNYHMYHYAPYERKILTQLSKKYACDPDLFNAFFANSSDLYRIVERHTDWPSHSYSIKSVSKLLGFEYSERDPGGLKAAMWYIEFTENPKAGAAIKKKIIQYNKEDCEAMIILKDWIVARSRPGSW